MVKTKLFLLILAFVLVLGCGKGKEGSEEPKKTEDTTQKETTMEQPAEKAEMSSESKTEKATAKVEEAASTVGEAVKEKTTEMTEAVKETAEEAATAVKEAVQGESGPDGAQLFQSKGCAGCHKGNADTVGPSLQTITKVYQEKNGDLVQFLKGEAESIVDPAKSSMMKPLLNPLKSLSDEELQALADYILQ